MFASPVAAVSTLTSVRLKSTNLSTSCSSGSQNRTTITATDRDTVPTCVPTDELLMTAYTLIYKTLSKSKSWTLKHNVFVVFDVTSVLQL